MFRLRPFPLRLTGSASWCTSAGAMRAEVISAWLETLSEAFSWMKPIEVIERGEVDRIWRMIHELESGEPT